MALPIKVRLGVALLLAFVTPLVGAETVYKWVDEHGVTQFSALPPADRSAEKLKVEAPEIATGAAAEAQSAAGDHGRPKDITEGVANPSAADLAREEAKRTENCATAKRNLESLNTRAHVRIKDEKTGEDRYLTPDEHTQWKKDSALRIDEYCKPARR
ncbi:MAG: DUF4124 domain-containing protein [Porticoccaceae bacterium]|nr:MAG: DUF4124 domain-containing protein [Porticoccaceae bacterium]